MNKKLRAAGFTLVEILIALGLLSVLAMGFSTVLVNSERQSQTQALVNARNNLSTLLFQYSSNADALIASQHVAANAQFAACTAGVGTTICSAVTPADFELTDVSGNVVGGVSTALTTAGVNQPNNVYYDSNGSRCTYPGQGSCLLQATSQFTVDCGAGFTTCPASAVRTVSVQNHIGSILSLATGKPIIPLGSSVIKSTSFTGVPTVVPLTPSTGFGGGSANSLAIWNTPTSLGAANITENLSTLNIGDATVNLNGGATNVAGALRANSTLNVAGISSFASAVTVGGNLGVAGANTSIAGSLNVSGSGSGFNHDLTIGGNLGVNGLVSLNGALDIDNGTLTINHGNSLNMFSGGSITVNNGGVVNASAFNNISDRRLKTDIQPIDDVVSKVDQLAGVSFRWRENDRKDIGLIAQDVEKIFPDLVHTTPSGVKSVEYSGLVAALIEAYKIKTADQKAELQRQKNRIDQIESYLCERDKSSALCR